MWKIGSVKIDNPIVIAPMAGISNPVFREVCKEAGAGLCVSEMISDKALHYQNQKTFDMCRTSKKEHPVSLQLFSGDPETMAEATGYLCTHTDCDIIDINMGCPVTKVLKAHSGSYLLDYPDLAVQIAEAAVKNADRPVTVKMRAGRDSTHIIAADLARRLEEVGISAIAIHGRTRSQMYEGHVNLDYIKMVKEAVSIPVIGNGDILTVQDAIQMQKYTGCDAVMIGRGVLGRPFFISEVNAALQNAEYQEPSYLERIDMSLDYARRLCEDESERIAMRKMRGMAAWYVSGMPQSKSIKNKLALMDTYAQMEEIMVSYKAALKELVGR